MTFGPTVDPVLLPPDIEALTIAYLTPLVAPTLVTTRMPSPTQETDTISGLLRVEYGGGSKANRFQYDVQVIMNAYNPNETDASLLAAQAVAAMSAARGQTIDGWYVVGVMAVMAPTRLSDPDVILPRYLSSVTWRVAGQPWMPA